MNNKNEKTLPSFDGSFPLPKACDFNIEARNPKGNNLNNVLSFSLREETLSKGKYSCF